MKNIVVKIPGERQGIILLGSHYDTKRLDNFVGADDGANLVVQDLIGGAGQGAQSRIPEPGEKGPDRQAERRRALRDLQWRKGVEVHVRDRRLDVAADGEIGLAAVIGMNAALKADLRRASRPRFGGAADNLFEREVVRRAAQGLMRLALGEGAERAAVRADVGVVDVAVDDIADDVAACLSAKRVGCADNAAVVGVARREQAHDLRRVEARAVLSAPDDALDRRIGRARMNRGHGRGDLRAGRPIVIAREPFGVAEAARLRGDLRRRPGRKVAHVRGIYW